MTKPEQDLQPCRRARIALRKVDIILKEEGIEAAACALSRLEAELKTVMITRAWIRDYKTMLEAWQSGLVQDVVNEFYAFGFRRALCAAGRPDLWKMKKFRRDYYHVCQRALTQMSERFKRSISDLEEQAFSEEALQEVNSNTQPTLRKEKSCL